MIVAFQKPWDRYNSGEKAGFSEEEARRLLRAGIAVPIAKPEPLQVITKRKRGRPRKTKT